MQLKVLREDELQNIVAVLVGTRPGVIKMSPIIRELKKRKVNFFVIHAGQHYSYNMDKVFFKQLRLSDPNFFLSTVKNYKLHGEQTAEMLKGIEKILVKMKPKILLVCGDANFNLAGALAARKLGIMVGHVESGLRSNDWRMPEEHNRVMIDHISEYLFAPTPQAKQNLIEDKVKGKIFIFGNTIVDAVYQNIQLTKSGSDILSRRNLRPKNYFLLTVHREENVDNKKTLTNIIDGLRKICKIYKDYQIVFPIHPRTKDRIEKFGLRDKLTIENLKIIDPVGYLDFLALLYNAKLVLTDSGGVQEEACILKTPCVTLRENTERPETVQVKANVIVGNDPEKIFEGVKKMIKIKCNWYNPFGDGKTAEKIIDVILKEIIKCN